MIDVLIIGAGMYVCGRGTDSFGTILPAVFQAKKKGFVDNIFIASTSKHSSLAVESKVKQLNQHMMTDYQVIIGPQDGSNSDYWKEAINRLVPNSAVIISTPDYLHYEMAKLAIEKKFATLVVKPLTPTLDEAKKLANLAKTNNVHGVVEFHKRFDRSNRMLRDCINKNELGDILYFIVEYSQRRVVPEVLFKAWAHRVNIFQYLGVHYVDIIAFATKAIPIQVMARAYGPSLEAKGIKTPDAIICYIEWELDGHIFMSSIHTSWVDPMTSSAMSDQKIKVIGTSGRFEADQKNRGNELINERGNESLNPDFCRFYSNGEGCFTPEGYGIDSIMTFLTDALDIIQGKSSAQDLVSRRPSFENALPSVMVVEAANKSLLQGGAWVSLKESL